VGEEKQGRPPASVFPIGPSVLLTPDQLQPKGNTMFTKVLTTAALVVTAGTAFTPNASAASAAVKVKSISVSIPGGGSNNKMVASAKTTSGTVSSSGLKVTQRSANLDWPNVSAVQRTGYVNLTRNTFSTASYTDTQLMLMGDSVCAGLKVTGRFGGTDALRNVANSLKRVYGITETQAYVVGVSAADQLCCNVAAPLGIIRA
jgi:ferric-dicitrate binding protein FerR (iron transport regulator)